MHAFRIFSVPANALVLIVFIAFSATSSICQTQSGNPEPALMGPKGISASAPNSGDDSSKVTKGDKTPLNAISTVKDNVAVEAGLLTKASAKQLFGGWVADHFMVVQVTIGNQSREQQFILQDIFFDYSNWGLSGIYSNPSMALKGSKGLQDYQKGTNPAQISSIGALEVHDAFKSGAVFSPRNFVVNGLILVGTAAGGFAFLGPAGFTQGVTGYNSAFIPGIQKFWPDRSIDQQSNILKYGFQDKFVVAKEDPGKTYAFFPLERFLTKGLSDIYKEQPALFMNMAELYIDPQMISRRHHDLIRLKTTVDELLLAGMQKQNELGQLKCFVEGGKEGCVGKQEFNALVLSYLFSPCYYGKGNKEPNSDGEPLCPIDAPSSDSKRTLSGSTSIDEIRWVKNFISNASLNSVRVVVSGIMTVDVQLVPAVLTSIDFDSPTTGQKPIWVDTSSKHTGVIYGRYLSSGTPVISSIKLASGEAAKIDDYIDRSTISTQPETSTDSELHFSVQFKKLIPTGSTLTFQVSKSSSKAVNSAGRANTQETTTSMSLDYLVTYTDTTKPTITETVLDKPADLLAAKQTTGHFTGTNLTGLTVSIKSITLVDKSAADVSQYVSTGSPAVAPNSTATTLNFTLTLKKGLPASSTIVLQAVQKAADGTTQTTEGKGITVPAS